MRTSFFCVLIVMLSAASEAAATDGLEGPLPVLVDGVPLDVQHSGHAAPFFGDFDGDGFRDLLVGELHRGRLRIYLNKGSNRWPQFDRFFLFKDGAPEGCIRSSGYMGFGPQLVDFDGDGDMDLLTGDISGHVNLFERLSDSSFADAQLIKGRDGNSFRAGYSTHVHAADWDDDGDLDLLIGSLGHGELRGVLLLGNEGTRDSYAFADPVALEAGGQPIDVPGERASPAVADWDGDGLRDLVIGCGDGSVIWCRNRGEPGRVELELPQQLVPPAKGDRGTAAKICVTDWNRDGVMDLLVGDCGEPFDKVPSDAELRASVRAHNEQEKVFKAWASAFRRYRELLDTAASDDHATKIAAAREELARWNRHRERLRRTEEDLQPGKQHHGRVWLYEGRRF